MDPVLLKYCICSLEALTLLCLLEYQAYIHVFHFASQSLSKQENNYHWWSLCINGRMYINKILGMVTQKISHQFTCILPEQVVKLWVTCKEEFESKQVLGLLISNKGSIEIILTHINIAASRKAFIHLKFHRLIPMKYNSIFFTSSCSSTFKRKKKNGRS